MKRNTYVTVALFALFAVLTGVYLNLGRSNDLDAEVVTHISSIDSSGENTEEVDEIEADVASSSLDSYEEEILGILVSLVGDDLTEINLAKTRYNEIQQSMATMATVMAKAGEVEEKIANLSIEGFRDVTVNLVSDKVEVTLDVEEALAEGVAPQILVPIYEIVLDTFDNREVAVNIITN